MFKLNLKIAWRSLWKNKGITAINIGGLAVALAAFILVMMYFTYETSFDKDVKNYNNIYVVGRTFPDNITNYTPPPLGKAIKENFPEVVAAGLMKQGGFEFAVTNRNKTVFAKKYLMLDYAAARMFNIIPDNGLVKPTGKARLFYMSRNNMQVLFPDKKDDKVEMVVLGSKAAGQTAILSGGVYANPHSNINFDAISLGNEIGEDEGYGYNNYATYIQVKDGTNIDALQDKISKLYQNELIKGGMVDKGENASYSTVFLDPLKNQHLRPKSGNDTNYKVLIALSILGFAILVIACINFTNLSIAQAARRAKEVGIKKVMGAFRLQLTVQFLIEILMQCLLATVLSLILAEILLPKFNQLFMVNLAIWQVSNSLIWQLPLSLLFITLVAGFYPAMVLSGFRPALVLKGNFQTSRQSYWLRNSLLVIQFSVAVIFIAGLLIINSQLKYMRTQDVGFNTNQVVYIKNMTYYSNPAIFAPVRNQMMKISGVKSVTVTNTIPDGSELGINSYAVRGREENLGMIDVDFDYFETLDIKLKQGRFFSRTFSTDTLNSAVINEAAVAKFGMVNPIGKQISGSKTDYKIIGVIKDFKGQGFEKAVEPTIYAIKNPSGNPKLEIMVKIEQSRMAEVLATLKSKWPEINKNDGDYFRYQFLDEMYGKLFKKQEQLQSVFFAAALLTIFIAILGLFAFAKFITNGRMKEIAVRKILGASDLQVLKLINTSFFIMVLLANLISWPLAYILTKKWLETFAYRIDIPVFPFVLSAIITIGLTIITVSLQARRAVKANPVDALKYE